MAFITGLPVPGHPSIFVRHCCIRTRAPRSPPRRPRLLRFHCDRFSPPRASATTPSPNSASALPAPSSKSSNPSHSAFQTSPPTRGENASPFARLVAYTLAASKKEPFILIRLVLALLCVLVSKLVALTAPFYIKRAVDLLSLAGPVSKDTARAAVTAILLHGAAKVVAAVAHEARNGIAARAGQRLGRRVTLMAFSHLLAMDAQFHNASRTGALTRVVDRGTRSVMSVLRSVVFAGVPSIFELLLVCGVLVHQFSLALVSVVLVTFVLYIWWTLRMSDRLGKKRGMMNDRDNDVAARATSLLYNADTVALFNAQDMEVDRIDVPLREYEKLAIESEWMYASQNTLQTVIFTVGLTVCLVMAAVGVSNGAITVGDVVMVSTLLSQLWVPVSFLGWNYRETKQSLVDIGNMMKLLDVQPMVEDSCPNTTLEVPRGEVVFDSVSFSYPKGSTAPSFTRKSANDDEADECEDDAGEGVDRPVLNNVSFTVKPGKTLALVGETGSGKSSALRLLSRIYDVSSGSISIDGVDIRDVSLESLRANVCVVPQQTVLWNDSVAFNIRYGRPSATDAEVEEAAKASFIYDTIARMPAGFETPLGERGVRLSGGEAQRISAARAMLRGAPILLQDEATAALDSKTEKDVTRALNAVSGNATRIVVAHRLSTVTDADEIIVLDNGKVVERGTHQELVGLGGQYGTMWAMQTRGEEEASLDQSGLDGKSDA